ncbi:MAG: transposase [Myxococcales bacterium]|jgi:putative transposase|nr:transposase [Myxococcales bacterium]
MPRTAYSEEEILLVTKEVQDGARITPTCRRHGIDEPTFYR